MSWCISSSYSKSEMARSPLTIAIAPFSRAKSTSSVLNISTSMLSSSRVASRTNWIRSAAENSVWPLRHGWLTIATITRSYIADARLITSRWPLVMGSNVPGQIAVRLSSGMDPDQRVSVAALAHRLKAQLQRLAAAALADHQSAGCEHRLERRRQPGPEGAGLAVWGVEEDKIVLARLAPCGLEEGQRRAAPQL